MKTWQETGFTWEYTADRSPTLRVNGDGESMHHSGGALEETLMIYGEPLREGFASSLARPQVMSLGLGLGYVELVAAAHALRTGKSFRMLTFESVPALIQVIDDWLEDRLGEGEFLTGMTEVAGLVATATEVPAEKIRLRLRDARRSGDWSIAGALTPQTLPNEKFHLILYDVFSAKTTPDLWQEQFLMDFFAACCEHDCLFSTYACTGNLKRSLKNSGFEMIQREGFKGKRNSTLGRRGIFSDPRDS